MRIYRIAQLQATNPQQMQQMQQVDPQQIQEVAEAIQQVNMAIANVNKSLETLEQTGTMQLFSRNGVIQAIQSGDMTALDATNVDQALQAMQGISQSALALNNALAIIKNNAHALQLMKMDIGGVMNMMVTALTNGDYSAFQSTLSNFQSQLGQMTATNTQSI